jgi:hypothetical protein
MALAADSIRHLTRAYIGARVYQGLMFWFVLLHNINAVLTDVGYPNPRLRMWLTVGAIVSAATLGSCYQWRFGRVEPPKRSPLQQVRRATIFALLLAAGFIALAWLDLSNSEVARQVGARPIDLMWLLLSAGTAASLAASRGESLGWAAPLLASLGLLVTLVVPALQPYRALGHAGMAAALLVTAVQLHLFLVRGFRHAHV